MASEIKLIAQPRNGSGNPTTFDYKPGGKHPAEAGNFYKISVDGKEELPVGTKISRKGNSLVFEFPDGTNFTIDEWCSVSDSRLTELVNGEAYSVSDAGYVPAKDIDSGTCVIWADAGQAGAVLGDSSVAPVTTAPPPAGGDDHMTAGIIAAILGAGALAAAASSGGGGGGGDSPDKSAPTAGTPDALNEDFSPTTITAAAIRASDDRGANQIQVVSATIKSTDGGLTSEDVEIIAGNDGPVLQLTESGANKIGTITTTIQLKDAAGNVSTQDVVFTVNAVNDAPVNDKPLTPLEVSFFDTDVTKTDGLILFVTDPDETTGLEEHKIDSVKIDVPEGTLNVTPIDGSSAIITGNDGSSQSLTISGTQAEINALLDTIVWHNPSDVFRDVILKMTSTDKSGAIDIDEVILRVGVGSGSASEGGGVILPSQIFSSGFVGTTDTFMPAQSITVSNLIGDIHQVPPSA